MRYTTRTSVAILVLLGWGGFAPAHYHILIADKPAASRDETVTLEFQFGHPYEHQFFNTAAPKSAGIVTPDGNRVNLLSKLEKVGVPGADGKTITGYRAKFAPTQRG